MSWHTREFASRAWDHIAQIRDRIDHLPLLMELADGTLEPRRFVEYIIQDDFYLRGPRFPGLAPSGRGAPGRPSRVRR